MSIWLPPVAWMLTLADFSRQERTGDEPDDGQGRNGTTDTRIPAPRVQIELMDDGDGELDVSPQRQSPLWSVCKALADIRLASDVQDCST